MSASAAPSVGLVMAEMLTHLRFQAFGDRTSPARRRLLSPSGEHEFRRPPSCLACGLQTRSATGAGGGLAAARRHEPSTTLKIKDVKRTWRGNGPCGASSNCLTREGQTRPRAGIFRDGETRNRTGDTTIFRDAEPGLDRAKRPANRDITDRVQSATIPVDNRGCPWVKDVAALPRPFHGWRVGIRARRHS
jgi:hypothetical protein